MKSFSRSAIVATVLLAGLLATASTARATPLEISGRHFLEVDEQTVILVDGAIVPWLDATLAPGMKVTALYGPTRGIAPEVTLIFDFDLRGPVTGTSPVSVLGQDLLITGDTTLSGYDIPEEIQVGDAVVVSGQFDTNGSLAAGFIERLPVAPGTWRLSGTVTATGPGADELVLGNQPLGFTGVTPVDCAGGPVAGDYIVARADEMTDFVPGQPLTTITDIQCVDPVPPGTPGAAGGLEGVVGAIPAPGQFVLGTLLIEHDAQTVFANGGLDDLEPGALVELEGTYLTANTVLADDIEFVRPVVRAEAPVEPSDVTPGESITILGMTFLAGPQLRDEDAIIANGLAAPLQVQVRGWVDSAGQLFANRVRERGNADPLDLTLRGPVSNIQRPLFDILDLTVDTNASTFTDEFENPLTADEFFALLEPDTIAEISGAQLNAGGTTLSGGVVTYIGPIAARTVDNEPRAAAGDTVFGTVTLGIIAERLFINDFE